MFDASYCIVFGAFSFIIDPFNRLEIKIVKISLVGKVGKCLIKVSFLTPLVSCDAEGHS